MPRKSAPANPFGGDIQSPRNTSNRDEILAEFSARWHAGECPRAEDFMARLQPCRAADLAELVCHEFCLAQKNGRSPDPYLYFARFPELAPLLRDLLTFHGSLESTIESRSPFAAVLPEVGDEIGPYRLLRELGRGGLAGVFLAEQADLEDRLVVLKIAPRASSEPKLMARARHPHIVEVLRQAYSADGSLHVVTMPFLGGATLASVLNEVFQGRRRPTSGRAIVRALDRVAAPEYRGSLLDSPARELVGKLRYRKAVSWFVSRLAQALDHAQRLGVTHGDLKPSNVLLTAECQPALFDFNLSIDWHAFESEGGPSEAGTLAYMAPERLRAIAAPASALIPRALDRHRADIYSLGLILKEALAGQVPRVPDANGRNLREVAAWLARERSASDGLDDCDSKRIPPGLRSILARCLAPDPQDRYRRAADLATDLELYRQDRAPSCADDVSARNRVFRAFARNRGPVGALAFVVLLGIICGWFVNRLLESTKRDLAIAKYSAIMDSPNVISMRPSGRWNSARGEFDALHAAERELARYDVLGPNDWRTRDDVRVLPEQDRLDLESWILTQSWRMASALISQGESLRALALLDRIATWAPVAPVQSLRGELQRRVGIATPAQPSALREQTAWLDDFLRGVEVEEQRPAVARVHYENLLSKQAGSFWGHYRLAKVANRLGDRQLSLRHLTQCVRTRPKNPALRTVLASRLYQVGQFGDALIECEKALAVAPNLKEALWNHAFIRAGLGQTEPMRDAWTAFARASDSAGRLEGWRLRQGLSQWLGPDLLEDADLANHPAIDALTADPTDLDTRVDLARQFEASGLTDAAVAEYSKVVRDDPDHLPARFRRSSLLLYRDEANSALALNDLKLLVEHPRFAELVARSPDANHVFAELVVDQIRKLHGDQGLALAKRALVQAKQTGRTIGESHYLVAQAYANLASWDRSFMPDVIHHLEQASPEYPAWRDYIHRDPIFFPILDEVRAQVDPRTSR